MRPALIAVAAVAAWKFVLSPLLGAGLRAYWRWEATL